MERVAAYEAVDIGSTPILRAKNLYLIFIKKFVIIYIQINGLSDIVPHIKGSYSKSCLEE